jgi:hypothetical protein
MNKGHKKMDYSIRLIARIHDELNRKIKTVTALLHKERQINNVLRKRIVELEMSLNQHT